MDISNEMRAAIADRLAMYVMEAAMPRLDGTRPPADELKTMAVDAAKALKAALEALT